MTKRQYETYKKVQHEFYVEDARMWCNDNGVEYTVHAGDVMICPAGTGHSVTNIGEVDAELCAVIVYA